MEKEKCDCQWCNKLSPIIHKINDVLSEELKKDFDELLTIMMSDCEDGEVAQAKLDGVWPGWEWLPDVIKSHNQQAS